MNDEILITYIEEAKADNT